MTVCLLILNYNGQEHLKDCLPSALLAAKNLSSPCAVVVVDNQSTEDDVEHIRKNFPQVEIISAKTNDYLFSFNEALDGRPEDIVFLLNNDMRFDPDFLSPMLGHFTDQAVFAVSAKTMDWEGSEVLTARRTGYFKNFWFYKEWEQTKQSSYSLEFCGGACAIRRQAFLSLGGFDRLYFPGYCEDTDISYRAWKKGWKVIYEPKSVI